MWSTLNLKVSQAQLIAAAARSLGQSGILAPVSPRRLWSIARQARQMGRSIATLAMVSAVRFPDSPAIIDEHGTISFQELDQRAHRIACAMATQYQVQAGDTVALMCRNHRGFVESFLAAMQLGAHVVLLNTDFPGPQLEQVLGRHALKLLIHDQEFTAHVAQAGYAGSRVLAWVDTEKGQPCLDDLALHASLTLPRVREGGHIVLLTSGTTGVPKGAPRIPNGTAYLGSAISTMAQIPLCRDHLIMIAPPLFHGLGLAFMITCLGTGAPMALQRRFRPVELLQFIHQHQAKVLVAVPAMLQRMLDVAEGEQVALPQLSAVLSGAAPLSGALATRWMDQYGDHLYNLYGSSEAGFCALATPADLRAASGTVGRPPLGTRIRIMDSSGKSLPTHVIGHIGVKSPMLFDGYVGGGHKASLHGYMNTGDVGHVDAVGRLFVDGREDDMIVSGGENVYPQEIEELLTSHPSIAEVAVIGVADAEFGQRLQAFVVFREGRAVAETVLRDFIRAHVARYKMPREFVVLAELPRNITGKVLKKTLQHSVTLTVTPELKETP